GPSGSDEKKDSASWVVALAVAHKRCHVLPGLSQGMMATTPDETSPSIFAHPGQSASPQAAQRMAAGTSTSESIASSSAGEDGRRLPGGLGILPALTMAAWTAEANAGSRRLGVSLASGGREACLRNESRRGGCTARPPP